MIKTLAASLKREKGKGPECNSPAEELPKEKSAAGRRCHPGKKSPESACASCADAIRSSRRGRARGVGGGTPRARCR